MIPLAVITAAYLILRSVATIAIIGRPRKPVDPLVGLLTLPLLLMGILWIVALQERWAW